MSLFLRKVKSTECTKAMAENAPTDAISSAHSYQTSTGSINDSTFIQKFKNRFGSKTRIIYIQSTGSRKPIAIEIPRDISPVEADYLLRDACELHPSEPLKLTLLHPNGRAYQLNSEIPKNAKVTAYKVLIEAPPKDTKSLNVLRDIQAGVSQMESILESQTFKKLVLPQFQLKTNLPKPDPHFCDSPKYEFSQTTKDYLKTVGFDNWQWDYSEIVSLFELMFEELDLISEFQLDRVILRTFLNSVRELYKNNPFHNFRHAFCVSQMMYALLFTTGLVSKLKPTEKLILMLACIGHDLDHPGFNNAYQINALTDLAITYNDIAPLENHHCACLFIILNREGNELLVNLPDAIYAEVRKGIIRCILATDMSRHGEIIAGFKKCTAEAGLNWEDAESRSLLLQMVIKCSDISNEVRPNNVSDPWVDCLLEEFFTQSDTEKALGLPTAPFMDREKVTKSSAQVGFIGFVLIPLYEALGKVLPMEDTIILPIRQALSHYKECLEREKNANAA